MGVILHETEAAGGFGEAVEAHYETFDLARFGEEGVDLFFGGVEGEVADVEGCGVGEFLFEVRGGGAVGIVTAAVIGASAALFVL